LELPTGDYSMYSHDFSKVARDFREVACHFRKVSFDSTPLTSTAGKAAGYF
jgi:hypothetical protein